MKTGKEAAALHTRAIKWVCEFLRIRHKETDTPTAKEEESVFFVSCGGFFKKDHNGELQD